MKRLRKKVILVLAVAAIATMLGSSMYWYGSSAGRAEQAGGSGGDRKDGWSEGDGRDDKANEALEKPAAGLVDAPLVADGARLSDEEFQRRIAEKLRSGALRLPRGVTDIEGLGGSGFDLAFKKNGVWFPVYGPPPGSASGNAANEDASDEERPLAEYPLMIASPSPPRGRMDEPYAFRFEAMGGAPPYQWSLGLSGAGSAAFALDPASGTFAGQSPEPLTARISVQVSDAEGGSAAAVYPFVIEPSPPLKILTASLDPAPEGAPHSQSLSAEGGVPPYLWTTISPLPSGLTLSTNGELQGTAMEGGEFMLEITATDSQSTEAMAKLALRVTAGLEITTPSSLMPAVPGSDYVLRFEVKGGQEPRTWHLVEGDLPRAPSGAMWSLSSEGVLAGVAPAGEAFHRFALEVRDAAGATFSKAFDLAIRGGLIVVPSRNKAGIAWRSAEIAASLGAPVAGVTITRSVLAGGQESQPQVIYQGAGTNLVDRGLPTGAALRYALIAHTPAGTAPVTSTTVTILPMAGLSRMPDGRRERAVPGVTGDPYADAVALFQPLTAGGWGSANAPANVTGAPDGKNTSTPAAAESEVLSLHALAGSPGDDLRARGGSITLAFTNNIVELGAGADFTVFENVLFVGGNPNRRFMEPAIVEVALFEGEWHRFSVDVTPGAGGEVNFFDPFYYTAGFAGRNGTTGDDPTNPQVSGGDSFDADALRVPGLSWIRFIRIQSTGDSVLLDQNGGEPVRHNNHPAFNPLSGRGASGFDLDAVSAVNY